MQTPKMKDIRNKMAEEEGQEWQELENDPIVGERVWKNLTGYVVTKNVQEERELGEMINRKTV